MHCVSTISFHLFAVGAVPRVRRGRLAVRLHGHFDGRAVATVGRAADEGKPAAEPVLRT